MLDKSSAFEASDRSIAASMLMLTLKPSSDDVNASEVVRCVTINQVINFYPPEFNGSLLVEGKRQVKLMCTVNGGQDLTLRDRRVRS